uniref:Thioredoxin domain-containing protein n=1 Tax=Araucaria cunninghamii TaxID=56994 RepID=A0A0D6QZC2_ARACU
MACIGLAPLNCVYASRLRNNSQISTTDNSPIRLSTKYRPRSWRCQVSNEDPNSSSNGDVKTEAKSTQTEVKLIVPDKRINRRIGFASVTAAVGLFVATRGWFGGVSLGDLAATAIPYDKALKNGMPTLVEFYADWCEVCRELAPEVYKVEQEYKDKVNFVMLNVDNSKWEEEIDEFGVEGIPHFAFLDGQGNEEGNVVGRIPRKYLSENLAALVRGDKTIPHSKFVGQSSNAESRRVQPVANPMGHSNT